MPEVTPRRLTQRRVSTSPRLGVSRTWLPQTGDGAGLSPALKPWGLSSGWANEPDIMFEDLFQKINSPFKFACLAILIWTQTSILSRRSHRFLKSRKYGGLVNLVYHFWKYRFREENDKTWKEENRATASWCRHKSTATSTIFLAPYITRRFLEIRYTSRAGIYSFMKPTRFFYAKDIPKKMMKPAVNVSGNFHEFVSDALSWKEKKYKVVMYLKMLLIISERLSCRSNTLPVVSLKSTDRTSLISEVFAIIQRVPILKVQSTPG